MMKTREDIFVALNIERVYQDGKFGTEFDDKNTINDWVTYITNYASNASFAENDDQATKQLLKVAALALAAIEAYERNGNSFPNRHYDS